ncbi:MAG: rod shape-determining protein MreC [Saprospiraceae bacterium]|jgi:rod shape-determining protein MreC
MRNLIFLFVKHGGFVTFLLMEMFCMFLVVNNNSEQNAIFNSSLSVISNVITDKFDGGRQFIQLSSLADSLNRKNASLLQERDNAIFVRNIYKESFPELDKEQKFTFTAAKVISNSTTRNNNSLTINRGSAQGVKQSMGIMGGVGSGVIGIVKSTTTNHARILPILHSQSKISASVKRNGYFGSLIWKGGDPAKVNLADIPKHANLTKGDTIQTSGYSSIFPEGIMIGTIDTFWLQEGTNFYEIVVKLGTDMSNVKYVYVVENLMKHELDTLQKQISDE